MTTIKYQYLALGLVVIALLATGAFIYKRISAPVNPSFTVSSEKEQETAKKVSDAYAKLASLNFTDGDQNLATSLQTLRDIAADTANSNIQRARALNGIYNGYTASNFDADALRSIVFSQPPFSAYYVAAATSTDPLRPMQGMDVGGIESALYKLLVLSNTLYPNHYAIARLQIGDVFSYQRDLTRTPSAQRDALKLQYAQKIKDLNSAYEALPIEALDSYGPSIKMQIMYLHADALQFVGSAYNDKTYLDRGEADLQAVIRFGETYPTTSADYPQVRTQLMYARIFYASHYWEYYRETDPDHIKNMLRPLLDKANQVSPVYTKYLPMYKESRNEPARSLRSIAAQMPELKTYLEELGWKF